MAENKLFGHFFVGGEGEGFSPTAKEEHLLRRGREGIFAAKKMRQGCYFLKKSDLQARNPTRYLKKGA